MRETNRGYIDTQERPLKGNDILVENWIYSYQMKGQGKSSETDGTSFMKVLKQEQLSVFKA